MQNPLDTLVAALQCTMLESMLLKISIKSVVIYRKLCIGTAVLVTKECIILVQLAVF